MFLSLLPQDFRGISPFQPLTLTVEHIIKPISLPKPSLLFPEVQFPHISHQLDRALEPPWSLHPPAGAYQQQMDVPTLQPPCLASTAPTCYAPQRGEQSVPAASSSKNLSLAYGMCVESSDHSDQKSSKPKQMPKEVSPGGNLSQVLDENCSHWNYKGQAPDWAASISSDTRESICWPGQSEGGAGSEHTARLSLALLERGGCYRQQPVTADTDCLRGQESLSALLSSASTRSLCPGEDSTEQWLLPQSQPAQLPGTREAAKLRTAEELSSAEPQDVGSAGDSDTLLAMFFKDLNLTVVWD